MAEASELIEMTVAIVSAYVGANELPMSGLPELIVTVHATLRDLSAAPLDSFEASLQPAVPVKRSVTPDHIICLEDGKKFKSLKRHLRTRYGMSPEEYKAKWGLPHDYPMVAPNYAKARSALAKKMGLGTARRGE